MGRAENAVEQRLRTHVEQLGGMCLKFTSSRTGVPDRIVICRGRVVFVELKAPGGSLSRIQRIRIQQMRDCGADVRVLASKEAVDDFVEELTSAS